MSEIAKVLKVEKKTIVVQITKPEDTSSCSSCGLHGICASGKNQTTILRPEDITIDVGDFVEVETPQKVSTTKLSALLYGVPLVILLGGGILVEKLFGFGDAASLGVAAIGVGLYNWFLNGYSKKNSRRFAPFVLRKAGGVK